jgi:hypothetical protein
MRRRLATINTSAGIVLGRAIRYQDSRGVPAWFSSEALLRYRRSRAQRSADSHSD